MLVEATMTSHHCCPLTKGEHKSQYHFIIHSALVSNNFCLFEIRLDLLNLKPATIFFTRHYKVNTVK